MNIIELAKQAGLRTYQEQAPGIDGVVGNWADLEAFAKTVAAHERDAVINHLIELKVLGANATLINAIRARGTT
jgi:hypothetical protein